VPVAASRPPRARCLPIRVPIVNAHSCAPTEERPIPLSGSPSLFIILCAREPCLCSFSSYLAFTLDRKQMANFTYLPMPRANFITSLAIFWGNSPNNRPRVRVVGREAPVQRNSSQRLFADGLWQVTPEINDTLEAARDGAAVDFIEIVHPNLAISVC